MRLTKFGIVSYEMFLIVTYWELVANTGFYGEKKSEILNFDLTAWPVSRLLMLSFYLLFHHYQ